MTLLSRIVRRSRVAALAACFGFALFPDRPTFADGAQPAGPPPAKRAALKVGDKAPEISGWNPDGNALSTDGLNGKTVLVVFWELDAKGGGLPFEPVRAVRRATAGSDGFLILTVCANGSGKNWDGWSKVVLDQGAVDYGDGARRFIDDAKWWNVTEVSSKTPQSVAAYGVTAYPEYFVIKPDGTLGGVRVPEKELKETVQKLLKR